ncbi:MAG: RluA family pseudouridine synthase [Candidatus Cloacimonetes bacterium]|nr:RluA family pseudouridine synthase [Candidatus Cloacimonadota bacterium]
MKLVYKNKDQERIDKYISRQDIKELYSRSYIDKLIKNRSIKVNEEAIKKNYLLSYDDIITIDLPAPLKKDIEPQNIPLEIIWEDDDVVLVNKPAGLVIHPGAGVQKGTLANALMFHYQNNLSAKHDALRPGIVHRLDKDTSGLVIVAKNDKVHSLLTSMFQNREIKKTYLALTIGIPVKPENTIKTRIGRSKRDRVKMAVTDVGKEAVTHYKIIKQFDFFSLVEIELQTGRTHQIRVHFSHINCPILGDRTYSTLKRTLNIVPFHYQKKVKYLLANHLKRQALHAYKLEFKHPVTNELISQKAPIPEDFNYTLDWLNKYFITE